MKNVKIKRFILFILIIVWAIAVFSLSNQNGEESSGLSRKIVEFFTKDKQKIEKLEPIVRKLAHFSEYALGGVLFFTLFSTYEWSNKKRVITSIALGIWYALLDECHQLLVPDRHGSIIDVCIDSCGFITGVIFIILIFYILKKKEKTKVKTEVNCSKKG